MPQVSEGEICEAVLGFVTEGAYPEEKVVAAEFPAAALAKELELISQAREQVEVSDGIYVLSWNVLTSSNSIEGDQLPQP
jgi:hypothetical protein